MSAAITSKHVLGLLAAKHSKDVFVPECKDGPTHSRRNHWRMDAWVMPRSWAHPNVTAYEIKVSRQDFLRDEKWPVYLDLCNSLYLVAPKGLIDKSELAPEVGLLEVSTGGKRLMTKKKAQLRADVKIPEEVFRYVLMCRATIGEERQSKENRAAEWEDWLRQKRFAAGVGWKVTRRVRDYIAEVDRKNEAIQSQNNAFEDVRAILTEAGIKNLEGWRLRSEVEDRLKEQRSGANRALRIQLKHAGDGIARLVKQIDDDLGRETSD